jgi:excinuclease UvrABC nuclease subunit
MATQIFNENIEGYWRDKNKGGIPDHSGVYFVYEASYNSDNDTVSLRRLIYIGEAVNVRERIGSHEKYNEWLNYVGLGNELCFSTGYVESSNRNRVEAAYIFQHKPPVNIDYKSSFPFEQTTIISSGKTALLNTSFIVNYTLR